MMNNNRIKKEIDCVTYKAFKKSPDEYKNILPGQLDKDVFLDNVHSQFIIKDFKKNRSGLVFHTSKIPLYDIVVENNLYKGVITLTNEIPSALKYDDLYYDKIFVTYGKLFTSQKQRKHFIIYDHSSNAPHIFVHVYKHLLTEANGNSMKSVGIVNPKAINEIVLKQWNSYVASLKDNCLYSLIRYSNKSANLYLVIQL